MSHFMTLLIVKFTRRAKNGLKFISPYRKWSIGDTVSCLLSVDGDVSFWLNGQDLGVGLRGIDTNLDWYPAVSLSLEQQCRVNFGHDPFL